jgi:hypothetical protein
MLVLKIHPVFLPPFSPSLPNSFPTLWITWLKCETFLDGRLKHKSSHGRVAQQKYAVFTWNLPLSNMGIKRKLRWGEAVWSYDQWSHDVQARVCSQYSHRTCKSIRFCSRLHSWMPERLLLHYTVVLTSYPGLFFVSVTNVCLFNHLMFITLMLVLLKSKDLYKINMPVCLQYIREVTVLL